MAALASLTAHELGARYRSGEAPPPQAATEYLARIEALDPEVRAFLTVTREAALRRAAEADARFKAGAPLGPLDGVPVALKDVLCTRGIRTTSGSKILERFVPPYDATVVARLFAAGAVLLGKLNMNEFAMGSSTEHSAFFTTHNPWDLARVPGGSSGGAARGHAPALAAPGPASRAALGQGMGGLRLGVPAEYFMDGMDPEVEQAVRTAIATLEKLGARTEPVSLPHTEYGLAAYYVIAPAEASSNLARYDGVKYGLRAPGARDLIDMYSRTRAAGFGAEVKRRVMLGTYVLSAGYYDAYYGQAQKVRTLVRRDFEQAFARVDLIVAPTTPGVAFKMGEREDPLQMYLNDIFTIPVNLAGLPGVSIPGGFTQAGLPIGLQLIAPAFDEATLLRVAHAYQTVTDWHTRRPALDVPTADRALR